MRLHLYHHYYFLPSIYVILKHVPLLLLGKKALQKSLEDEGMHGEQILLRSRPSPLHLYVDYQKLQDPQSVLAKSLLMKPNGYSPKVLHPEMRLISLEEKSTHFPILRINKYMPL